MPDESAIIPLTNPTQALDMARFYPASAPLEIDVGCGKGRFLTARAQAHPNVNFLGIDRMVGRLRKMDKKIHRAGLTNVRLLHLEASYTVCHLLPLQTVSMFHIFFPDPWPKRRHHRRRLFNPDFLSSLHKALLPHGQINLATDHLGYFAEIHALFSRDPRFEETPAYKPEAAERTEFERLFTSQELPIRRFSFKKA